MNTRGLQVYRVPEHKQLSRDVPEDAGCLCDTAAVHRDNKKGGTALRLIVSCALTGTTEAEPSDSR